MTTTVSSRRNLLGALKLESQTGDPETSLANGAPKMRARTANSRRWI